MLLLWPLSFNIDVPKTDHRCRRRSAHRPSRSPRTTIFDHADFLRDDARLVLVEIEARLVLVKIEARLVLVEIEARLVLVEIEARLVLVEARLS